MHFEDPYAYNRKLTKYCEKNPRNKIAKEKRKGYLGEIDIEEEGFLGIRDLDAILDAILLGR